MNRLWFVFSPHAENDRDTRTETSVSSCLYRLQCFSSLLSGLISMYRVYLFQFLCLFILFIAGFTCVVLFK